MFSAVKEVLSNAADASLHILGMGGATAPNKPAGEASPAPPTDDGSGVGQLEETKAAPPPMSPARIRADVPEEVSVARPHTATPSNYSLDEKHVDTSIPMDAPPIPKVSELPAPAAPEPEAPVAVVSEMSTPRAAKVVDPPTPPKRDDADDFSFDRWKRK